MQTYAATTEGIKITVRPVYLDGQSDAMARKFVFAYFIKIENNTQDPVQLLRRHWYINDSNKKVKQVEGEGVVGKQPTIMPGESHEYNSFSILETMEGFMEGTYLMQRSTGEQFNVKIPRFLLRASANWYPLSRSLDGFSKIQIPSLRCFLHSSGEGLLIDSSRGVRSCSTTTAISRVSEHRMKILLP